MIRKLTSDDFNQILDVINDAAVVFKGKIPEDCWKEPYMSADELLEEIRNAVDFFGYFEDDVLVSVMGIQPIEDVTLIRHAYTLPSHQRRGFGEKLLKHLLDLAATDRVFVGTWENAVWAIRFYQKFGFCLLSFEEKTCLLNKYWNIPKRQVETSVVLELKRLL